jgi:hypothetical protein
LRQFHRVFEKPFHLFSPFAVDFSDLHPRSKNPCQGRRRLIDARDWQEHLIAHGGSRMDEKLRAAIDEHLARARAATTLEQARAEYEAAVTAMLEAYAGLLQIMNLTLQEELLMEAEQEAEGSTRH